MRGEAMKRICCKLEDKGYNLSTINALEFFAREGDWQTIVYAGKVKTLCAWEIDPKFENMLKKNLPKAEIEIGDSFILARKPQNRRRFDMIVFDNPQALYGKKNQYCEHFEALEAVPYLLSEQGIVIFNINYKPFDFDDQKEWQRRRERFYGLQNTSILATDFLLRFYGCFFQGKKFNTKFSFIENRNDDYLAYLVFGLERR